MGPPAPDEVPPPTRIVCQGLLGLKKKRCVDQRYFVLYEEGLLNYYLNQQAFEDGLEPRGRVNVEDIAALEEHDDGDGFEIEVDGKKIDFVPADGQSADMSPWVTELERQITALGGQAEDEDEEEEEEQDEKKDGEESGAAAPGNDAEEAADGAALCHGLLEVTRKGKSHTRYFALYADRMVYFASGDDFASGAEFRGKVLDTSQVISLKEHSEGFTIMTEVSGVPQAPLEFKGAAGELPRWHSAWRRQLQSSLAGDYQPAGESGLAAQAALAPAKQPPAPAKREPDTVEPEAAKQPPAPAKREPDTVEPEAAKQPPAPAKREPDTVEPEPTSPRDNAARMNAADENFDSDACVEEARDIRGQQTDSAIGAQQEDVVAEQSPAADERGSASQQSGEPGRAREGPADSPPSAEKKPARPSSASRGIPAASERRASQRRAAPSEQASPARPTKASAASQRHVSPVSRQSSRVSAAAPRGSAASARATSRSATPQRSPRTSEPKASARLPSASAQAAPQQPPSQPPWLQAIGTEGVIASGPLTMQGLGVNGEEVYCALLPDRFLWSQAQTVDANVMRLTNVRSVDVHNGGFDIELGSQGDEPSSGTSKIQLRVVGPDVAAAAEAGPKMLAKMHTEDLRHARQVDQELLKWEEALHKVDWPAMKQDQDSFVQARSQSRNIFRSPAEGRPPQAGGSPRDAMRQSGQSRSPSPRRGHRGPAEAGPGSPRDATKQSAQELARCQGRLGFSVQGTLQWRYAMLFGDRLDAWDSKEAARAGQARGVCPPVRIATSTCQSMGFVDQGFLLKTSGKTHGVHVGPDQDELARWSSALASVFAESRSLAAASPRRAHSPDRQQPNQSSERGSSPAPGRATSPTGRHGAPKLNRSITLRKDEPVLSKDERPRRAKA